MHILAFSSGLYSSFIDASGLRYPSSALIADYLAPTGVVSKQLITPNLKMMAQTYFNCSTL
jgi:hypothetical protein